MTRSTACDPGMIENTEIKIRFFTARHFLLEKENFKTFQHTIRDQKSKANHIIQEIYHGIMLHEQGRSADIDAQVPMRVALAIAAKHDRLRSECSENPPSIKDVIAELTQRQRQSLHGEHDKQGNISGEKYLEILSVVLYGGTL